ncbi:hypothetical protein RCL1_009066 [Eukaryota sp. TZLM3-RCL]
MSVAQYHLKEELKARITSLPGFDSSLWEDHWKLYNARQENRQDRFVSDRRRHLSFEVAGIKLHEVFFSKLKAGGSHISPAFAEVIKKHFGTIDNFHSEILNSAKTRGIGWTLLCYDAETDSMYVNYCSLHQLGHCPNVDIIFCLDHWEHAYRTFGVGPQASAAYMDALYPHVDWEAVEQHYNHLARK